MTLWLLACTPKLEPATGHEGVLTELSVDEAIVVRVVAPGAEDLLTVPHAELEMEVSPVGEGAWEVTYTGEPGSYVLDGYQLLVDGERIPTPTHYVDFGVQGPSSDLEPLASLAAPPERSLWPWWLGLAATGFVAGGVLTGVLIWRNRARSEPLVPDVPPDVEALKAWAEADALQDDHAKALALSAIFRRYVERVSGRPASAMTSFEVLEGLDQRFDRDMSKRLLQATDQIKFAREAGSAELFAELGEGLRSIIIATRPPPPEAP